MNNVAEDNNRLTLIEERLDGIEARIERLEGLYGIDHKSPTPTCTASIEDNRCLVSVPGCQVYITSFAHGDTYEEAARMGTEAIEVALAEDTQLDLGDFIEKRLTPQLAKTEGE